MIEMNIPEKPTVRLTDDVIPLITVGIDWLLIDICVTRFVATIPIVMRRYMNSILNLRIVTIPVHFKF